MTPEVGIEPEIGDIWQDEGAALNLILRIYVDSFGDTCVHLLDITTGEYWPDQPIDVFGRGCFYHSKVA
jgi:hypothetical protein